MAAQHCCQSFVPSALADEALWSAVKHRCVDMPHPCTDRQTCPCVRLVSLALTCLFSFPCVLFPSVYSSSSFSSFPLPCSPFGELERKLKFFFGVFIYLITLICTKGESHKTELHRDRTLLLFQCREATPACVALKQHCRLNRKPHLNEVKLYL